MDTVEFQAETKLRQTNYHYKLWRGFTINFGGVY